MVSSSTTASSIVSVVFIVFLFTTSSAREVRSNGITVEKICSRTNNPSYCRNVVGAMPNLSHRELIEITFELYNLAGYKATDIYNGITPMLPKATSAQKVHLEYCHSLYKSCTGDILHSFRLLTTKNFVGFQKRVAEISNSANLCEHSFGSPPSTPSVLTQQNREFSDSMDIVLAATHLLMGQ